MVQEPRPVIIARLQGLKADGSHEDIKTNDAGALEVHDSDPVPAIDAFPASLPIRKPKEKDANGC